MARYRKVDTYLSDDQKAERRAMLTDLVQAALERLEGPDGWRQYLIAESIWEQKGIMSLTPTNLAMVAMQAPGQVVGKYAAFPVRKGMKADTVIVGPHFWPTPVWRSGQFPGLILEMLPEALPDPCPDRCARLARLWSDLPNTSAALQDFIALNEELLIETAGDLIEQDRPRVAEPAGLQDIPF
jgi:hypothetical protein